METEATGRRMRSEVSSREAGNHLPHRGYTGSPPLAPAEVALSLSSEYRLPSAVIYSNRGTLPQVRKVFSECQASGDLSALD